MDAFLTALVGAAPQFGVGGVLLLILGLVMRSAAQDRTNYRQELASDALRHREEIQRLNADHDAELAELRRDIAELRTKLDEVEARLDAERKARREAEDVAAQAIRGQGSR